MGKKLYISLASLVAIVAFAAMPTAAQATTCEEAYAKTAAPTEDATEPPTFNPNVGPPVNATNRAGTGTTAGPARAARENLAGEHVPIESWSESLTLTNQTPAPTSHART